MGGLQKRLMGVLAVNVDEAFAQVAQLRRRDGNAVDPGARASLVVDRSADEQRLVRALKFVFLQPAVGPFGRGEFRNDVGALRAFANDSRIAASAEDELERVDQNGLPRTRFPRENGEPPTNVKGKRFDDHEVAKTEAREHGGTPTRERKKGKTAEAVGGKRRIPETGTSAAGPDESCATKTHPPEPGGFGRM